MLKGRGWKEEYCWCLKVLDRRIEVVLVVHVVRVYISGGALKRTIGVSKVLMSFSVQVERYTMKAKKRMHEIASHMII